jgi:hypothetical protein
MIMSTMVGGGELHTFVDHIQHQKTVKNKQVGVF